MIKNIYKKKKPQFHTTLNDKRMNVTKIGNKKGSWLSSLVFSIVLACRKGTQSEKEE